MPNERLRGRMAAVGVTIPALAAHVEVDPKTVERWISQDRTPHRRHRWATAELLESDETFLWPAVANEAQTQSASSAEFVRLYPHRGMVPDQTWLSLIDRATEALDILVYAGLFLIDTHPDLTDTLAAKAARGTKIRFLIGNPEADVVSSRGVEEGIGDEMAARIRMTMRALKPLKKISGIQVRQHSTILYNSLYRFDSNLLVNVHVYGSRAPQNPVIHLQRVPGGRLFDHYLQSFEQVWATGISI